ncbi:MAG: ribulose-phosphate 3-epimerase [Ignavibacteria bacterium]|nr:ribulose-phosphate 3-epimerase [Ignavibacteria bacterium]
MNRILIEPSLLSANYSCIEKEVRLCEEGQADLLHLDIMDGCFVPNITFGPIMVRTIKKLTQLPLVCHLMIVNPERYIPSFVESGASYISVHCEGNYHIHRLLEQVRSLGVKSGLAINPGTPLEYAFENAGYCDFILLMSVNPGFGGQTFIQSFLKRCERLKNFLTKESLENVCIEVDGGIKVDNVADVVLAGANMIVSGSGIFEGDIVENLIEMRRKIEELKL